jgi:hypothetical protein
MYRLQWKLTPRGEAFRRQYKQHLKEKVGPMLYMTKIPRYRC